MTQLRISHGNLNAADTIGPAELLSKITNCTTGTEGEFAGVDLFVLQLDISPPALLTLHDVRTAVSAAVCPSALQPPASSMWNERWSTFSPLERTAWCVAALTDTLAREARLRNLPVTRGTAADWPAEWNEDERARVECLIYDTQVRAGFYPANKLRFRPPSYGWYWRDQDNSIEWFEWMHNARKVIHDDCLATIRAVEEREGRQLSYMDVGCGKGIGYEKYFADRRFVGVDLGTTAIDWCKENLRNSHHTYITADVQTEGAAAELAELKCDFVLCHGTIDCSWDSRALLESLHDITGDWVYISAARGWFPDLANHRYMWQPTNSCFYNDLSPLRLEREMKEIGFIDIEVSALASGRKDCPYETRIVARRAPI